MAGSRSCTVGAMTSARSLLKYGSAPTSSAPTFRRANVAKAEAISDSFVAPSMWILRRSARDASSTSLDWVPKKGLLGFSNTNQTGVRDKVVQKSKPLRLHLVRKETHASEITERPVKACHKTRLGGVCANC